MFKNIVIPTDGSELADKAVATGLQLARETGARVTLLRVTSAPMPLVYEGVLIPVPMESIREEVAKRVGEHLGALAAQGAATGVAVETLHIERDQPWQAIVDTARERGADLIVMASHGRRGLSAVLLGSETQKVLTHSAVPVLVCR